MAWRKAHFNRALSVALGAPAPAPRAQACPEGRPGRPAALAGVSGGADFAVVLDAATLLPSGTIVAPWRSAGTACHHLAVPPG